MRIYSLDLEICDVFETHGDIRTKRFVYKRGEWEYKRMYAKCESITLVG